MIRERLTELASDISKETGCTLSVNYSTGYPAVWNNEALFEEVQRGLGEETVGLVEKPALAAEDFSFYQRKVPGVFFFLGAGDTEELHSPAFVWDDEVVLPKGLAFVKRLISLC